MDEGLDRQLLLQLTGEVRAIRWALKVIIATHPDPSFLRQVWHENLSEVTDELLGNDPPTSEAELDGWKKTLAQISQQLAATDPPHHPDEGR